MSVSILNIKETYSDHEPRLASDKDWSTLLVAPHIVKENDKPVLLYRQIHSSISDPVKAFLHKNWKKMDHGMNVFSEKEDLLNPFIQNCMVCVEFMTIEAGLATKNINFNKFYYFRDQAKFYHKDLTPKKDALTAVLSFNHDINGGFLVLPKYRIGIAQANSMVTIFNGTALQHGVTPIIRQSPEAYRMSIVFY